MLAKKRETDSSRFPLVQAVGILKWPNSIHVCMFTHLNGIRMLDARRLKGVHPVFSVWWALALHTDAARTKGQLGEPTHSGHVRGPACLLSAVSALF